MDGSNRKESYNSENIHCLSNRPTSSPFLRNNIMTMTDKHITISLNQAIQLRGVLNTSASDLREIVERHEKGYPFCGKLYHEYKAEQLKKFGKIIDKKIKGL
jgi:hypothetical protein